MVEYYFEFVLRRGLRVDSRYLDREVIPESRREEFTLVRPSVAFLIQQSAGTPTSPLRTLKLTVYLDLSAISTALPPNLRTARYLYIPRLLTVI